MVAVIVVSAALVLTLLAAAAATARARHRTAHMRSAFRCKVAIAARPGDVVMRWPRQTAYAVWVHDVLVLFDGITRTHAQPYAVHFAEGSVETSPTPVKGLGPWPVVLAMQLDDGRHALLAADRAGGRSVPRSPGADAEARDVAGSSDRSGAVVWSTQWLSHRSTADMPPSSAAKATGRPSASACIGRDHYPALL